MHITLAPSLEAPRTSDTQNPAGSTVPSPGLYNVPYKSSTFSNGYNFFVSEGDNTCDSIPNALPICTNSKKKGNELYDLKTKSLNQIFNKYFQTYYSIIKQHLK